MLEVETYRRQAEAVVGVGTLAGGRMPPFLGHDGQPIRDPETPLFSQLEREALQEIASAAGGQYFELDRDTDRNIANAIIDFGKRRSPSLSVTAAAEPLYWYCLLWASMFMTVGLIYAWRKYDRDMGVRPLADSSVKSA